MKMTTTPPTSWTGNLFHRPPLGVYTVTGTPEDAVARCLDLWVTIGVREHAHGMPQQFARRGGGGTEISSRPGSYSCEVSNGGLGERCAQDKRRAGLTLSACWHAYKLTVWVAEHPTAKTIPVLS